MRGILLYQSKYGATKEAKIEEVRQYDTVILGNYISGK